LCGVARTAAWHQISLTLHDAAGLRLLGFDNAHSIFEGNGPRARTRIEYDHKHAGEREQFYDYQDAGTLVSDFWAEVDKIPPAKE
jgi:hypothetical protein